MLPLELAIWLPLVTPFPSKVEVPTIASRPGKGCGGTSVPLALNPYVPFKVLLEQTLSSACTLETIPTASVMAMAIKVFAIVVLFMVISLDFLLVDRVPGWLLQSQNT